MNKDNKFNIGGGFNVDSTQPIDSRTVAKSKAELTLTGSTWNSGTTYNGLLVSVVDTNNPDDDGIYMLIDSPRMWMESSWIKIGTEGGDTGDTKLFDTYALVLKDSNISVAVDKNDNYVYGLPNQNYIKVLNDDGDYKDMNEVILTISNIDTPSEAVAYNYKWQGGAWVMGETGSTPNVYTINNVSGNSKQFNFEISADTSNTLSDAIVNIVAKFKEAGANTYIAAGSIKINTIVADTIYNLLPDASVVVGVMTEDGYMPTPPSVAITGVSIESIEETGILIDQSQVEERGLNITCQVYKRSGAESADYELGSAITIDVNDKTSKVIFNLYDTNSGETLLDVVEIPVIWDGEPGRNTSTNAFDFDNENLNLGADASGNYSFGLSQHNEAYFYYGNIKGTFEVDDVRTLDVYDNAGGAPIFTMTTKSGNTSGVTLWCDVDEDDNDHVLVDITKETPSSNVTFFKFDKAPYTFKVTTTTYVDGQSITGVSATFKVNMRKDLAVYDILPTVNAVSMKYDSGYKPISGTPTAITSNLKVTTSNGTDIYKAPNIGLPEGVQGFSLKVNDYIGATGHTTGDDTSYSGNSVFIFSMGNPTAVTLDGTDSILVGADGAQGVTGLTSVTFKQPKGLVFALLDDYADENETVPFLYDGVQGEKGQRGAQGAQGVPGDPSDAYIMDIDNDTVILSCDNNGVYQYGYENIDLKVFINTNIPVYSAKTITGEVRGTSTGLTTLFDTGYTSVNKEAFTIKAKTGTGGTDVQNGLKNINLLTDPIFIDITGTFEKPATGGSGTDEFSSTAVLKIIGTIGYPTDICLATSAATIEKVGGINAWVNGGVWNYSCGNSLQPAVSVYDGSTNTLIGISNFNAIKVNEKYRKIKVSVSGSANTKEVRYLDLASGSTSGHSIVLSGDGKCILTGYETAESGSTTSTAEIAKPRTMVLSFTNSGINDSEDISIVYDGETGPQGPQGNGGANGVGSQDIYTYWSGATAVTTDMSTTANKNVFKNVGDRFNSDTTLSSVTANTTINSNTVQLTYYRSPQECTMEAPTLFAFRRYFTGGNWGSFDYAWVYSRYAASTPGRSGKMLYPAGQYDENAQYTVTSGTTPYVCITGASISSAAYYYLNDDTDSSTTKTGSAWAENEEFSGGTSWYDSAGKWVKMDSFAAIYGDIGIFNTALVGQAVFYKEFILSQDGIMVRKFYSNFPLQQVVSGVEYIIYDQNFGTSGNPIYVGTANVSGGDYYNKFMNNTACHTYYNNDIYTPSGNFFLNNSGDPENLEDSGITEFFKPNYVVNLSTGFVSNREGTYGPIKYTQDSFMTEYTYKGQTASTIFSVDSDGLYFGTDVVKKVRFFAFADAASSGAVNTLINETISDSGSTAKKTQIFYENLKNLMENGSYSGKTLYGQPSSLTYSDFFSSTDSAVTASKAIYDRLKGLGWYDDTDVTNDSDATWKEVYKYYKDSTTSAYTESLYPYELSRLVGYEAIFENTTVSQTGNSINITREGGTEINGTLSVSGATTIGGPLRVGNRLTIEMPPSGTEVPTGYTMTMEAIDINTSTPKLKFTVIVDNDLGRRYFFTLNPDPVNPNN